MASTRQLPLRWLLRASPRQRLASRPLLTPALLARSFHRNLELAEPFKDDQERTDLKPRSYDYTMSGSDYDASDHHPDVSYNPSITTPEEAKENCERERTEMNYESSPLEFSPANKSLSDAPKEIYDSSVHKPRIKSGERSSKKSGTALPRKLEPIKYRIG
ncbi:hypothetical protein B0T14DRAFT_568690 [Immersiella caudata]|uniref:Uncharacterized protein n=1 Tax=Immersiella caudata TaxID=314043 RepID=A0AA39WKM3_9PEZI|nr:hypothetical protein B0T14DRAFT_568690 [Immersiella caudata]